LNTVASDNQIIQLRIALRLKAFNKLNSLLHLRQQGKYEASFFMGTDSYVDKTKPPGFPRLNNLPAKAPTKIEFASP